MSFDLQNIRIGIVGLGYVGLPLAVEFGRKYPTVGFDVKAARIEELEGGTDSTLEVPDGFVSTASTMNAPVAAFESDHICGVQYHPEVSHTPHGQELIEAWLNDAVKNQSLSVFRRD